MDNYLNYSEPIKIHGGKLPHWNQKEKLQFITFRLADSLPQSVLNEYRVAKEHWLKLHPKPWNEEIERQYIRLFPAKMENYCDANYGKCIFYNLELAQVVKNILLELNKSVYELWSYVIMPNHVHLLIRPLGDSSVEYIMRRIKGKSSKEINALLNQSGPLWMPGYFDRIIRNVNHLQYVRKYIDLNIRQGGILWQ